MDRWTPDAVAALLVLTIAGVLLALGHDSEIKSLFVLAGGWVFGQGAQRVYLANKGHMHRRRTPDEE